jgi:NAD(P)H-nitrite reductase large subunit
MSHSAENKFITIPGYRITSLTAAELRTLWSAVEKFGIERIRVTPGSQIAVSGLAVDLVAEFVSCIRPLLIPLPTNGLTSVFSCNQWGECKNGCIPTAELVEKLGALELPQPMPARIKVAVAGCPRCCTMPRLRDIGFIPASVKTRTWHVYFGGHGGRIPRIGDLIGASLTLDESLELTRRALLVYQQEAAPQARTSGFMRTTSLENFLKKVEKADLLTQVKGFDADSARM